MPAQNLEFPHSTLSDLKLTWGKQVILALWKFHCQMWDHRNSILHKNTAQSKQIQDSPVDAQIRNFYKNVLDFASMDRVIFDLPLGLRFSSSSQSKKNWLSSVNATPKIKKPVGVEINSLLQNFSHVTQRMPQKISYPIQTPASQRISITVLTCIHISTKWQRLSPRPQIQG